MADAPFPSEIERRAIERPARTQLKVTSGPIRGSRKIHVEGRGGIRVAMRAVDLEPSSGEPPVVLYDTSGPYTDPAAAFNPFDASIAG